MSTTDPTRRDPPAPEDTPEEVVRRLFRVAKRFMIPFIGSWMLAYVGGNLGYEWLYYVGLGGVGVSILGLLIWLLNA